MKGTQDHHHHHTRRILSFALTSIFFFWLGTRWSGIENEGDNTHHSDRIPNSAKAAAAHLLTEQTHAQNKFQLWIRQSQGQPYSHHDNDKDLTTTTLCARTLTLHVGKDELSSVSWIESLEHIARALQVALATERRLLVSMEDASSKCPSTPGNTILDAPPNTLSMYCLLLEKVGPCEGKNNNRQPLSHQLSTTAVASFASSDSFARKNHIAAENI